MMKILNDENVVSCVFMGSKNAYLLVSSSP